MKVEVRCTNCTNTWMIDEGRLGSEIHCSSCQTSLPPAAVADIRKALPYTKATSSMTAAPRPSTGVAAANAPAAVQTVRQAAPPVADPAEDVVCPRCKLHFSPHARPTDEPRVAPRTVLIVEDLDYFRQIAADALSPTYEVKTAASSAEARAILNEGGIDLLVLDLTLDGEDEGRRLLTELTPKPCPILIFTAQDESEMYGDSWEELVRLGADDLVIKGMKVDESLVRKVGLLLGTAVDE